MVKVSSFRARLYQRRMRLRLQSRTIYLFCAGKGGQIACVEHCCIAQLTGLRSSQFYFWRVHRTPYPRVQHYRLGTDQMAE